MCTKKGFNAFLVGLFLCFAANISIMDLSSSLNVEDGLGTTSLAICYAVSLLGAVPTPVIGHKTGCKLLLIVGEVGYLLYMVGNLHSGLVTLIPAGLFLGLGEALLWTLVPIVATYFAQQDLKDGECLKSKIRLYMGYYHAVIEFSVIIGSGISFVVFYVDRQLAPAGVDYSNITEIRDLTFCGANDCQLPNITEASIEQYQPANIVTRYVYIVILAGMAVVSMIIFHFFIPDKIPWDLKASETPERTETKDSQDAGEDEEVSAPAEKIALRELSNDKAEKMGVSDSKREDASKSEASIWSLLLQTIKDTFWLAVSKKHLLVVFLTLYNGSALGFRMSEMTRSLSSCILGVDKVGVCSIIFSVASTISAVAAGKFAGRFGRNIPFLIAAVLDVLFYSFLLVWEITESNAWITYVLFFVNGVSLTIWNTLVTSLYGEYFLEQHKLAYNLWNIVVSIGLMWQFAISTLFCVYVKLYIQIGLLAAAMVTYFISQAIYYPDELWSTRTKKRKEVEPQSEEDDSIHSQRV